MDNHRTPLANVITLGARSVPALRDFYRQLGWSLIIDDEEFAAFELRGAVLALFAADKLAADGRTTVEPRQGGIRFTIGIMVDSRDDVDQMAELVRQSGGRLTKEPVDAEFEVAMKQQQWRIRRPTSPSPAGQLRWDRAYQHLLRWTQAVTKELETTSSPIGQEVYHDFASSDLCPRLAAPSSPGADD